MQRFFMNITEFTPVMMQNLGQQWYNAAKNDINTTQRMKLYADTEQVVTFLEKSGFDIQGNNEKIAALRHAVVEGFAKHKPQEFESLAKWVASNTGQSGLGTGFTGAYKTLHHLINAVKANNSSDIFDSGEGEFLAKLTLIDSKSLNYITAANEAYIESGKTSADVSDEVMLAICESMSVEELLKMREMSKQSEEIVNYVMINKLNNGKISFTELNIVTAKDLDAIFGEHASKIVCFEINPEDEENFEANTESSPTILCIAQLNAAELLAFGETSEQTKVIANNLLTNKLNAGEITFSDLNIYSLNDLKAIFDVNFCKIEYLEVKNNKPLDKTDADTTPLILCVAQLANIKELELPCFYIDLGTPQDISGLKHCTQLKTLVMNFNDNTDISVLSHCPKLKYLDISYTSISDISVLRNCPALKILFINGTKVTDINVLKDLRIHNNVLEKVQMMGCDIPDEALQELFDLGVDLIE